MSRCKSRSERTRAEWRPLRGHRAYRGIRALGWSASGVVQQSAAIEYTLRIEYRLEFVMQSRQRFIEWLEHAHLPVGCAEKRRVAAVLRNPLGDFLRTRVS